MLTPASAVLRTGNRRTACQWAEVLGELGHEVRVCEKICSGAPETLVALHGERSHDSIVRLRRALPAVKLILVLTGTDIYPEPSAKTLDSLEKVDRAVILQRKAIDRIPRRLREKVRLIVQSAKRRAEGARDANHLDVCVVGHLRRVKDPLRTAAASRLLPPESKIRIRHAGGILEPAAFCDAVAREQRENPRYTYVGELDAQAVAELIASSHLLAVTSRSEGGARVVGEAIVHGTPVISSRIDGVTGLLGDDYPGYFPPGDTEALADMLSRAEADSTFVADLRAKTSEMAPQFHPQREKETWQSLIAELHPAA